MNRRVECEGKLMGNPIFPATANVEGKTDKAPTSSHRSRKMSSPPDAGLERDEVGESGFGRTHGGKGVVPSLVLDSGLRKTRSDLSDLVAARLDLLNFDGGTSASSSATASPKRLAPFVPRRTSEGSNSCPSPTGIISPGSSSPSVNLPHPAYDHLSCQEQETKITLLRQCLASLQAMETSLKQGVVGGGVYGGSKGGDPSDDDIPRDELMDMFRKALDALDHDAGVDQEWTKREEEDEARTDDH
ncbi:uncharacterized protein [Panulirus ornatus]|uniref:uncharacterized protein n=1 Tax=Panulirus ornatus TaxID=150431 RepID=UPI003A8BBD61